MPTEVFEGVTSNSFVVLLEPPDVLSLSQLVMPVAKTANMMRENMYFIRDVVFDRIETLQGV
jgi:hypothetical protein